MPYMKTPLLLNTSLKSESNIAAVRRSLCFHIHCRRVQVGNDQEKKQSEKDSHSKNRGGKKLN